MQTVAAARTVSGRTDKFPRGGLRSARPSSVSPLGRCRPSLPPPAGNQLYGNVLYRPRGAPKRTEASPAEGKVLDTPREARKAQSVYSVSFPRPPTPQRRLAPKSCPSPRPTHLVSTVRVPPDLGPFGQRSPRGFLEVGRGTGAPGAPERTPVAR